MQLNSRVMNTICKDEAFVLLTIAYIFSIVAPSLSGDFYFSELFTEIGFNFNFFSPLLFSRFTLKGLDFIDIEILRFEIIGAKVVCCRLCNANFIIRMNCRIC